MDNLEKFYKNKKVLITGHTGFKGSWLFQTMLLWGAQVSGIGLKPHTKPSLFEVLQLAREGNSHLVDIRDFQKVKKVFAQEKPEIVFHLAAQPIVRKSYDEPRYTFETNTIGTLNVLESIRLTNSVRSGVIVTTDKVYENKEHPISYKETDKLGGFDPYSASKAAAEMVVEGYINSFFNPSRYGKSHNALVASCRGGNVIGGGDWSEDRIMPDAMKSIFETHRDIIIRNPNAVRPWQHVLELLLGYMMVGKKLYEGKLEVSGSWNFGPNKKSCISVKDLINETIGLVGEGSYTAGKGDQNKHEAGILMLDSAKARKYLGWRPILATKEPLRLTVDWYRGFYGGTNTLDLTTNQIKEFFTYAMQKL